MERTKPDGENRTHQLFEKSILATAALRKRSPSTTGWADMLKAARKKMRRSPNPLFL
jgi:hypothetical protein